MLSDSLFEARRKLLEEISSYAAVDKYPNAQKRNITLALYHLQLAQMAFDSFEYPDNHVWDQQTKKEAIKRAKKDFEDALNG